MRLEQFQRLVRARSWGQCEGCRVGRDIEVHHRVTRGMGGVHGAAYETSNNPVNGLALCSRCHGETLDANTVGECIAKGWVIERRSGHRAAEVPALIHTVNGYGWWFLTPDACYVPADLPAEYRITDMAETFDRPNGCGRAGMHNCPGVGWANHDWVSMIENHG